MRTFGMWAALLFVGVLAALALATPAGAVAVATLPVDALDWQGLTLFAVAGTSLMMEQGHIEMGKAPIADSFSTTDGTSDVVSLKGHQRARAVYFWGVGATGTVKFQVEACSDFVPTTVVAVNFRYRVTTAAGTPGAITRTSSASDGFTSAAGSNQIVEIEIAAEDLLGTGYDKFRIKCTEVVDSPILGGSIIELLGARHAGATHASAVS